MSPADPVLPGLFPDAVPTTARGHVIELATNVDVTIDGIAVTPGDLVIADGGGVVFVPDASASKVLAEAEQLASREAELAARIERGVPPTEVLGGGYERMFTPDRRARR